MCTASHSSGDGGCPGTLQTGLQEWCIGRPSGLPDAPKKSVLNAAAQMIFRLKSSDRITKVLFLMHLRSQIINEYYRDTDNGRMAD